MVVIFINLRIFILVANLCRQFWLLRFCIANSIDVALAISAPLLILLLLFAGFFLNAANIHITFIQSNILAGSIMEMKR